MTHTLYWSINIESGTSVRQGTPEQEGIRKVGSRWVHSLFLLCIRMYNELLSDTALEAPSQSLWRVQTY